MHQVNSNYQTNQLFEKRRKSQMITRPTPKKTIDLAVDLNSSILAA